MTRPSSRLCVLCGSPLVGRRPHARFCSGACRAEASRLRAILYGRDRAPYGSLAERLAAAQSAHERRLEYEMGTGARPRPDGPRPYLPLAAGAGPAGCRLLARSSRLPLACAVERDRRWRPRLGRGWRRVWSDRPPERTDEPEQRKDEALAAGEKAASASGKSYIPPVVSHERNLAPRLVARAADVKDVAVQTHRGLAELHVFPASEAATRRLLGHEPTAVEERGTSAAARRLGTCGGCWIGSDGRLSLLGMEGGPRSGTLSSPGERLLPNGPGRPHRLRSEGRPFGDHHSGADAAAERRAHLHRAEARMVETSSRSDGGSSRLGALPPRDRSGRRSLGIDRTAARSRSIGSSHRRTRPQSLALLAHGAERPSFEKSAWRPAKLSAAARARPGEDPLRRAVQRQPTVRTVRERHGHPCGQTRRPSALP
jgi:hypothetical protein